MAWPRTHLAVWTRQESPRAVPVPSLAASRPKTLENALPFFVRHRRFAPFDHPHAESHPVADPEVPRRPETILRTTEPPHHARHQLQQPPKALYEVRSVFPGNVAQSAPSRPQPLDSQVAVSG